MKLTLMSGETCVGDVRISSLDVGFDLRAANIAIALPEQFESVGLDWDGETYLCQGTRDEMVRAIVTAGYRIAPSIVEICPNAR